MPGSFRRWMQSTYHERIARVVWIDNNGSQMWGGSASSSSASNLTIFAGFGDLGLC